MNSNYGTGRGGSTLRHEGVGKLAHGGSELCWWRANEVRWSSSNYYTHAGSNASRGGVIDGDDYNRGLPGDETRVIMMMLRSSSAGAGYELSMEYRIECVIDSYCGEGSSISDRGQGRIALTFENSESTKRTETKYLPSKTVFFDLYQGFSSAGTLRDE